MMAKIAMRTTAPATEPPMIALTSELSAIRAGNVCYMHLQETKNATSRQRHVRHANRLQISVSFLGGVGRKARLMKYEGGLFVFILTFILNDFSRK